jgi:phosphomannomutase
LTLFTGLGNHEERGAQLKDTHSQDSLRARLAYEPVELSFGTSGRRGEVVHLTQLEIYINTLAELEYLQSLHPADGGIVRGDRFYFAYDLRPSSSQYVKSQGGRGEIAQAVVCAIGNAGMQPVNLGRIPTPAMTYYALSQGKGSIMVTGSHIPFDRNGYKVNTSRGELLKKDERPINERVSRIRDLLYGQPYSASLFDAQGLFKTGHRELPHETAEGRKAYINRYTTFYEGRSLGGMRLLCYQHSAVGRDLLVEILNHLGAETIPAGRSDTFVPIDTENIDDAQLASIQALAGQAAAEHGRLDAVVSTDGDSDRPLILGVDPESGSVTFYGGDLLGMIAAQFLRADAVVVPISCNDAIDRGRLRDMLEPRTRIGSPYVIEGMEKARRRGKRAVCGWEANGGFLTGSNIELDGKTLAALPTRDAVLPILCALFAAHESKKTLAGLFAELPKRFSRASLLKHFPRSRAQKTLRLFSPADGKIKEVRFEKGLPAFSDENGNPLPPSTVQVQELESIRDRLESVFPAEIGFPGIARLNYIDGVRITFDNGDVAHVRPSGNADELRIYAVADSQLRADEIARAGISEPDGILRSMERSVTGDEAQ